MPDLQPLRFRCPACGGADVVYTCEPRCCFNHACAACRATFYPSTESTGRRVAGLPEQPPPDCTAPTVACENCRSLAVYMLGDDPVCTACGAVLTLHLADTPD